MDSYDADSGRHPVNAGYLVAGLVFLGIATTWALRAADVIDDDGSRWVLPVVLILAGVAGLVASLARSVLPRHEHEPAVEELDPADLDPGDHDADPLAR